MVDLNYYKRINHEFYTRVGVIECAERLGAMGLETISIIGTFWPKTAPQLLDICAKDNKIHIVSSLQAGLLVNRYVEGDHRYWLADGDSDPNLELRLPPEVVNHIFSELNQLIRRMGIGF